MTRSVAFEIVKGSEVVMAAVARSQSPFFQALCWADGTVFVEVDVADYEGSAFQKALTRFLGQGWIVNLKTSTSPMVVRT